MEEIWKTMEECDGILSISNKGNLHRAAFTDERDLFGTMITQPVEERVFEKQGKVSILYKGKTFLFDMWNEMQKYFSPDELEDIREEQQKKLEEEKKKLEETFNKPYVESLEGEVWKPIEGYSQYEVSDAGRFKRVEHTDGRGEVFYEKLIFASRIEGKKGLYIRLWNDQYKFNETKLAAKVIADTFLKNPNNLYIVHHLDGNPFNIKLENLKWYDDSPSTYYEQKETKNIFKSLTDVCRAFHISKVKVKDCLAEGKPIKEGVTIVEKTSKFISSSGKVPVDMRIVEMKETETPVVPVETKKVILKKNKTVSNPSKRSRSILPIVKLESIPETIQPISTVAVTPLEEKWEPIPRYSEYKVSNKGEVKRLFHWSSYGGRSDAELEKPYEKNGLMYVKIHNSYDFPIEIPVERLVAETYLTNPNDYYLLEHIDGDYTNNTVTNLRWIEDTKGVMLKDNATKEECSIKAVAEVLNLTEKEVYDFVITFRSIGDFSFSIVTDEETKLEEKQEVIEATVEEETVVEDIIEETEIKEVKETPVVKPLKPAETTGIVGWKDVPFFEDYQVSTSGQIKQKEYVVDGKHYPAKMLEYEYPVEDKMIRPYVRLKNAKHDMLLRVDRIVASAFMENTEFHSEVQHKNAKWKDCRKANLEFGTPKKRYASLVIEPYHYICLGRGQAALATGLSEGTIWQAMEDKETVYGYEFISLETYKRRVKASLKKDKKERVGTDMMNLLNDLAKASEEATNVLADKEITYKEICTSPDWYCAHVGKRDAIEYFISIKGDGKKFVAGEEVELNINQTITGVRKVNLGTLGTFTIAQLVANRWLENPNNYRYALHKGDNSDDRVENLFWSNNPNDVWTDEEKKVNMTANSEEVWRQYEDNFYVSNLGNVIERTESGDILLDTKKSGGYIKVKINGRPVIVAHMVAEKFISNPNNYRFVMHKNRDNYDNRAENLFWGKSNRSVWVEEKTVQPEPDKEVVEELKQEKEMEKEVDIVSLINDLIADLDNLGNNVVKIELRKIASRVTELQAKQSSEGHYLTDNEYAEYKRLLDAKEGLKAFLG